MEFKVKKEDLLRSLTILSTIAGKSHHIPILSHILLKASGEKLILRASDGEISMEIEFPLKNFISDGSCTVPAKEITELFKSFEDDSEIHLKLDGENNRLNMLTTTGKYELATLLEDAFPEIPQFEGEYLELPAQVVKEMILKTSASVRPNYMDFNLYGAKLFLNEEKIRMVSTDAFRLSYVEYSGEKSYDSHEAFIPKRSMGELQNFIGDEENLLFAYDDRHLYFKCDNRFMVSQMAKGGFPNYREIIPSECKNECTVSVKKFKNSLSRIAIFTNRISNHIFLEFKKDTLTLSSGESEKGGGKEVIDIEKYSGLERKLKVNCSYLKEFLSSLKADVTTICVPESDNKPLLFISNEGKIVYKFVLTLL